LRCTTKSPNGIIETNGLWPVKKNGELGFDNIFEPSIGMKGKLRDDSYYLQQENSVIVKFDISKEKAVKTQEYIHMEKNLLENGKPYSLLRHNQCASFACDVANIAEVDLQVQGYKTPRKIEEYLKDILKESEN